MTTETTPAIATIPACPAPGVESILAGIIFTQAEQAKRKAAAEETAEFSAFQAARKAFEATPEYRAYQAAAEAETRLASDIREALEGTRGVHSTAYGKAGFEVRRTITYSPASVRELAPALEGLVIREVVDGKDLEQLAAKVIKAGKLPANTLAQLLARAEVKETPAWIFKPKAPEAEAVPETAP